MMVFRYRIIKVMRVRKEVYKLRILFKMKMRRLEEIKNQWMMKQ
jgi:hypothetical protein